MTLMGPAIVFPNNSTFLKFWVIKIVVIKTLELVIF